MFLRPRSYEVVEEKLFIYGYNESGKSICAKTRTGETVTFLFPHEVTEEISDTLASELVPSKISRSLFNPKALILRNPQPDEDGEEEGNIWSKIEVNTYGDFNDFFSNINVNPYDWFYISNPKPVLQPKSLSDIEITFDGDIDLINKQPPNQMLSRQRKVFYWDIETFSPDLIQFPNAENPANPIVMISVVVNNQGTVYAYLIVLGQMNNFEANIPFTIIPCSTEKLVLMEFYNLLATEMPDYAVSYNGKGYDIPYLRSRNRIHKITMPTIGRQKNFAPSIEPEMFLTPFGLNPGASFDTPGIEHIDLLLVFRKLYPDLPNHRLDTVGKFILGEGKTGLDIGTMMKYVASKSPSLMAEVGKYSLQDSVLLDELVEKLDLFTTLENISNCTRLNFNELFGKSDNYVVNALAYSIDPGLQFIEGVINNPGHLINAPPGIYSNITKYDYTNLYLAAMEKSTNPLTKLLGQKLLNVPPYLIVNTYYSQYVDREVDKILREDLDKILSSSSVIEVTNTYILVKDGNIKDLVELEQYEHYVIIDKNNSIIQYPDNEEFFFDGLNKITKPAFPYLRQAIEDYLRNTFEGITEKPPALTSISPEKFAMTVKLTGGAVYKKTEGFRAKLLQQYQGRIDTWVKVKWFMTTEGPSMDLDMSLDYGYYAKKINEVMKILTSLPLYE